MAHPYFHSLSSVRKYGGSYTIYEPVHSWYDSTKQYLCDARHRLIFHNLAGIELYIKIHGEYLEYSNENGSLLKVSNKELGIQHITEDFGREIGAEEILKFCAYHINRSKDFNADRALNHLIRKHKGVKSDYVKIIEFFEHYTKWAQEPKEKSIAYSFLCNSFGIFQLEKYIGAIFIRPSDNKIIPTRLLGENYINSGYGNIPTLNQVLEKIPPRSWMLINAAALSYQFEGSDDQNIDIDKKDYMQNRITPFPLPIK